MRDQLKSRLDAMVYDMSVNWVIGDEVDAKPSKML